MTLGRNLLVSIVFMIIIFVISKKNIKSIWFTLGILALECVMMFIYTLTGITPLSGFHAAPRLDEVNLIPFAGIADVMKEGWDEYAMQNICGNILMFAPVGFMLPLLDRKNKKLLRTMLISAGISLMIEVWQLFLSRGTDIDDLILNTVGALLGYGCYRLFYGLMNNFSRKFRIKDKTCTKICLAGSIVIPALVVIILGFYDRMIYLRN